MFNWASKKKKSTLGVKGEVQGNIYMDEDLYVDGIIHGSVEVHGTLEITETGLVEGEEVKCENIIVSGILKADMILAEKLIVIHSTAKVEGEIIAGNVLIEAGAIVCASMKAGSPETTGEFSNSSHSGILPETNTNSLVESNLANSTYPVDIGLVKLIMRKWNSEQPFLSELDQQK
jgi:cytoskeletal protein CcmA (bactofilin family)